jgi:hypothetical protein
MTISFDDIIGLRQGEERPGIAGARLEPRTASMQANSCLSGADLWVKARDVIGGWEGDCR